MQRNEKQEKASKSQLLMPEINTELIRDTSLRAEVTAGNKLMKKLVKEYNQAKPTSNKLAHLFKLDTLLSNLENQIRQQTRPKENVETGNFNYYQKNDWYVLLAVTELKLNVAKQYAVHNFPEAEMSRVLSVLEKPVKGGGKVQNLKTHIGEDPRWIVEDVRELVGGVRRLGGGEQIEQHLKNSIKQLNKDQKDFYDQLEKCMLTYEFGKNKDDIKKIKELNKKFDEEKKIKNECQLELACLKLQEAIEKPDNQLSTAIRNAMIHLNKVLESEQESGLHRHFQGRLRLYDAYLNLKKYLASEMSDGLKHAALLKVRDCALSCLRNETLTDGIASRKLWTLVADMNAYINDIKKNNISGIDSEYDKAEARAKLFRQVERVPLPKMKVISNSILQNGKYTPAADHDNEEIDKLFENCNLGFVSRANNKLFALSSLEDHESRERVLWKQERVPMTTVPLYQSAMRHMELTGLSGFLTKKDGVVEVIGDTRLETQYIHYWEYSEFCTRGSLEDWAKNNRGEKNFHDAFIGYAQKMLHLVDSYHQNGILFPDIKPGNFLISDQGELVMSDPKSLINVYGETYINSSSIFLTPGYLPFEWTNKIVPEYEALISIEEVGCLQSYLIGLSLYETFTGESVQDMEMDVTKKTMHTFNFENPVFESAEGKILKEVIEMLVKKEPSNRLNISDAKKLLSEKLKVSVDLRQGKNEGNKENGFENKKRDNERDIFKRRYLYRQNKTKFIPSGNVEGVSIDPPPFRRKR
ncbi:MAG: hypothetical protein A3E85_00605 [Gammaproteobacteria bacterium RIFCSPHIGHO2_12_FULL_45_12]|nr:MAG: hypothetical protein A3E85_00605 [Gammaproteobacteria bacterium RIFCSPHIGHO2_12_FULL_45_12]